MGQIRDLTGMRVGKLVVLSFSHVEKRMAWWHCRCDCGTLTLIGMNNLTKRNHPQQSCGCLRRAGSQGWRAARTRERLIDLEVLGFDANRDETTTASAPNSGKTATLGPDALLKD